MQVASTTRPLPYISDRAAELLEEVRAFRARQIPVKSIRLVIGGYEGELADMACIIFYCKGAYKTQHIQHPNNVLAAAPGVFVIQVESASRKIEKMWLIEELTNRLSVHFPMMFAVGGHDFEAYHGESTEFSCKNLMSALKAMASHDYEEEVAPPEPRKHATNAVLLEEILKQLGLTKAQVKAGGSNNLKLHLSADLDENESDPGNDSYVYNQFYLNVGASVIQLDEDMYHHLTDHADCEGECSCEECSCDEFYSITLDKVLSTLE